MVVSDEVFDNLKSIGLNLYERKLWVALLSKKVSTAGALSELADVPRSRVYDTLESLANNGFVIIQQSKPMKYVAVPPGEAFEKAKEVLKKGFQTTTKRIDRIKESEALKELEDLYEKGMETVNAGEVTGSLKGRFSMMQQLRTMLKNAEFKVNMVTGPKTLKEIYSSNEKILKKIANKGVKIKIATDFSPEIEKVISNLSSIGEVRDISGLKNLQGFERMGRFCVVDGKEILFALTHEDVHPTQEMHVWTQSPHAAGELLDPLFELLWSQLGAVTKN